MKKQTKDQEIQAENPEGLPFCMFLLLLLFRGRKAGTVIQRFINVRNKIGAEIGC